MKNRKILLGLFGLAILAAHAGAAFAGMAGQAQFVNGEVRLIDAAGQARALRKGDAINEGDTIDSAKEASAQIKMQDGGFIAVRPDTKLKFDSFKFKGKEDGTENSFFSLFKGGFRAVTGLIGRVNKQNYRISTPAATIGIRGTDHESFYAPANLPGIQAGAYSKVNIGETSLTTDAGAINVKPNQMGYAGGLNQIPRLQPLNTNIFTVAPPPAKEVKKEEKRDKDEKGGKQKQATQKEQKEQNDEKPARQIRDSAVVDNTSAPTSGTGAASTGSAGTGTTGGCCVLPVPPIEPTFPIIPIIVNVGGQPVDLAGNIQQSDILAQAAADAALAAANAAQAAATTAAANDVALAAVAQVSTAPATTAIGAATTNIGTVSTAVSAATALAPVNAATATANATSAQTAATSAASLATAAQNALTANGAFADATLATPANTATQSANTALQSANTLVQTAAGSAATAGSVPYYNAALTTAQGAATSALSLATANCCAPVTSTAQAALATANIQNAAIITAQGSTATPLAAAQAAVTAAQTAATAAQMAATLAASLQAAGDFTGAQAQLVIAQQQLSIAQAAQANAQAAQAAVAAQLTNAQTAQTAAGAAVTAAANAANTAATDAGTASTQASAAQTASTNATAALNTSANNLATVNTNAPIVAANAPIAAYSNPAVNTALGGNDGFSHWGLAIKPAPKEEFIAQGSAQPQTTYVLDGNKDLVEIRNSTIDGNGYDYFNPSPVITNADIKLSGGNARDHFQFTDNSGYMGRWEGGNIDVNNSPYIALGVPGAAGTTSLHWGVFLNPASNYVQSLGGTASYTLDAATHPTDSFGNVGTLNSATLVANFDAQTVNTGVNFAFANSPTDTVAPSSKAMAFSASANSIPITGSTFDASPAGRGSLVFACTGPDCDSNGYQGDIVGQFVGAGAIHAALGYVARALQPGGATATTTGGTVPHTDLIMGLATFSTATTPTVPSVTSASYTTDHILIEIASPFMTGGWKNNYIAAAANMTYTGSGLSSFTDSSVGGDGSIHTHSVTGGVSPITGTATSGATGIQFGRWTSVTALNNTHTQLLGGQNWGAPTTWMYGPQGYLDPGITAPAGAGPAGQMYGTFSYTYFGGSSTAPYDRQSGQSGAFNSASLSVDFTTNLVSASLALTVGGQAWSASATNVALTGNQFFASSYPGGTANNLTVSMGAGAPTLCTTCFGNLDGAFTAQNYYGAMLSYNLWDSGNAGGDISGHATLVRSAAVTNVIPATPTGNYFVADYGGDIKLADTLSTPGSVLSAYSSGNPASPGSGYMATSVAASTASGTTTSGQSSIYFGSWTGGSYTSSWGTGIGTASPHWITGPEAGPLFLPNALVGSKVYTFDGGRVTNSIGQPGTVLGTTALTVDFTRQVVDINIDLAINDALGAPHTWNAQTLPGNEAVINGGDGVGGATFHASSYNQAAGPGLLTVMVDGGTPGSGNVSGQLTGAGLNGAILSYGLSATFVGPPYFEQVNGVTALLGATSNTATPYRWVMTSSTDPTAIIKTPMLGFYANAPARMDGVGGNLIQFDMNTINDSGMNHPSKTLAVGTSAPSNAGSDTATGISWGRWDGGSVNVTNRATCITPPCAPTAVPLAGSLHWIAGPTETAAVTLPVSGAFTYTYAGGTFPTDNLNASGSHTATLSANFTAQTVNVGVNVSVGGSNLSATASNVPIIQKTAFYADSRAPNAQHLTVTCSSGCGTTNEGTIVGGFGGAGATGAMMTYGLEKIGGASAGVISGVAAFQRGAAIP